MHIVTLSQVKSTKEETIGLGIVQHICRTDNVGDIFLQLKKSIQQFWKCHTNTHGYYIQEPYLT